MQEKEKLLERLTTCYWSKPFGSTPATGEALGNLTSREAIPLLIEIVKCHSIIGVRELAAELLGNIKAVESKDALLRILHKDDFWPVIAAVARALGKLKVEEAKDQLTLLAKTGWHEEIRTAAKEALDNLKVAYPDTEKSDTRSKVFIDQEHLTPNWRDIGKFANRTLKYENRLTTSIRDVAIISPMLGRRIHLQ